MGNVLSVRRHSGLSKVLQLLSWVDSTFAKFEQEGMTKLINEAIVIDRQALYLCPPGHPVRWATLHGLQRRLRNRYNKTGALTDIEEAATVAREAVGLCPPGHPGRAISLTGLAEDLITRYDRLRDRNNLVEAIKLDQEALGLCSRGHPDRLWHLNNLATSLFARYRRLGEISDLYEAISVGKEAYALSQTLPGHPDSSMSPCNLANHLIERYHQLGATEDLTEAIMLGRKALELFPPGNPGRPLPLANVSGYLHERYELLGEMTDVNEAIVLGREALKILPPGHPGRSSALINVTASLEERYKRLGTAGDLNEAITLGREVLELQPPGHPDRSSSLSNLASLSFDRYGETGTVDDLNSAIFLGQKALELCPPGHPDRSISLINAANYSHMRFLRWGTTVDLNWAIVLGQEALDLCIPGHRNYSASLTTAALALSSRYTQFGEIVDLDEAIVLARKVLEYRPPGHPDRSKSLVRLADYLRTRLARLNQLEDMEDLFCLYTELINASQSITSADVSAAKDWVCVAEEFQHASTVLAYETSLRLLVHHLVTLPSLPDHLPILKNLASSLAVDAFSACLRNGSPKNAVEMLEQGRGIFWNQLTRLNSPLGDVFTSGSEGKTLADKFALLTSHIRDTMNTSGPGQHDRLCGLNLELRNVIIDIRKLPGLDRFLLPSLFSDLQQAASDGPLIILNASKYTCDALIVLIDNDPVHIPLQITRNRAKDLASELQSLTLLAKKMDVTRDLGSFLRDLWDEVVSPIVDVLQMSVPARSRIWWCPTAEFSLLPLHAAGPYRSGQRNLSHMYISSYTPTLTALIRARRHSLPDDPTQVKRFLGVGQAKASGESELLSIQKELTIIEQRVERLATFTRIEGSDSCIQRVSNELRKNDWVHLACHGIPNRKEPFDSAFALHDGHFTIRHIMRCELENPEFAYLSACHTTVGDEESPDEVIHLAAALQFAGFRSVIGTMWAVDDAETNKITSRFYGHMTDESGRLDHNRAAFALNETMNTIVDIPLDQRILYVHIGV